jgi:hypothetical protein
VLFFFTLKILDKNLRYQQLHSVLTLIAAIFNAQLFRKKSKKFKKQKIPKNSRNKKFQKIQETKYFEKFEKKIFQKIRIIFLKRTFFSNFLSLYSKN